MSFNINGDTLRYTYSCLNGSEVSDIYRSVHNGHGIGCIVHEKKRLRLVDVRYVSYSSEGPNISTERKGSFDEEILLLMPSFKIDGFRSAGEENLLPGIVKWHPAVKDYCNRYWEAKEKELTNSWKDRRMRIDDFERKVKALEEKS